MFPGAMLASASDESEYELESKIGEYYRGVLLGMLRGILGV